MDRIARAVEPSLGYRHEIPEAEDEPTIGQAMSNAACDIAEALEARAILVPTFTGRTASAVARLRPRRPIIGLTHHHYALQHMALEWGVTPVEIPECADVEELWATSLEAAREHRDRRAGRPRRDHRGHGREHPRHDERDQGRHRLAGSRSAAAARTVVRVARRTPAPSPRRPGACAGARRARRSSLRWCVARRPRASSPSSTTSRSRATSQTRADADRAHGGGQGCAPGAARAAGAARATRRPSPRSPREARRHRLVRPGERLFIVKGIDGVARGLARRPRLRSGGMDDRALVERQLGRPPRAFRRVAARCPFGRPAVTEQAPYDAAGEPFPTTYYLTCPHLVAAVARLEAAGGVERWSAARRATTPSCARASSARPTSSARSAAALAAGRPAATAAPRSSSASAAARNPGRLKCLHAHAAFALAHPGYELGERDPRRARAALAASAAAPCPV